MIMRTRARREVPMHARRLEQVGAVAGFLFVILLLVVLLAFPTPPDFGGSDRAIARYYLYEQASIQASNLIAAFAVFFLLWFLGGMRSFLGRLEPGTEAASRTAFGAGLVAAAAVVVALIASATAALRPEETQDQITRAFHDMSFGLCFAIGSFAFAAFFVAAAVVTIRGPLAWLGGLAIVAAICQFLGGGAMFDVNGPFAADGVFGYLPIRGLLVWVLVASVALFRGEPRSRFARDPSEPGGRPATTS
jgi:hypothetical protein